MKATLPVTNSLTWCTEISSKFAGFCVNYENDISENQIETKASTGRSYYSGYDLNP